MQHSPSTAYSKAVNILRKPFHQNLNSFAYWGVRLKGFLYYRQVFRHFGAGSVLYRPMLLHNPQFIRIGSGTSIRKGVRLEALVSDPANPPEISIGNNVLIEQNVQIIGHSQVTIGDNVSIAGHCAIVDVNHPYADVNDSRRIGDRIEAGPSWVRIGEGSFIGFGALILPRVTIGQYCIIGGNSVVTRDVPDYSVVAGSPARVIRQYDPNKREWISRL